MMLRMYLPLGRAAGLRHRGRRGHRGPGGGHPVGHLHRQGPLRLRPAARPSGACTGSCASRRSTPRPGARRRFAALDVVPVHRGRERRGRHRREGPAHRHLPVVGRRRPARQRHRLGRAHHPPADRHRRVVPERAQPAPEQGQGHADPRRPSWPSASGRSARPSSTRSAVPQTDNALGQPDPLLRAGARTSWSRTCAPSTRPATSQAVLDGDLDAFMEAWLRWNRGQQGSDGACHCPAKLVASLDLAAAPAFAAPRTR